MDGKIKSFLVKVLILSTLLLTSCARIPVNLGGRMDRRAIEETHSFYLWGLAGEKTLVMKDYCKNGSVAKVEDLFTGTDVLLTLVTFGIYAPRTSKIYCRLD